MHGGKKHKDNSINGDKNGGPLCRFTSTMLSSEGECHSSAVFSIPFPHHHSTNVFLFVPSHALNIGHKNSHLKWAENRIVFETDNQISLHNGVNYLNSNLSPIC